MARYRQPEIPGLPLFFPVRKKRAKRIVRQGGTTYRGDMPLGIRILGRQAATRKVYKANRRAG